MLNYYSCQLLEKASIGEDFADLSVPTSGLRQTIDTFSDGDFTTNPNRSGSTDSWGIGQDSITGPNISNAHVLKLDVSNTSVLKDQRPGGLNSPGAPGLVAGLTHLKTSRNHSYVWLWANASNVSANATDGYRIQLGDNSGDREVCLERVDDGSATTVITSSGAILNDTSDLGFLLRVTRNASSTLTLYTPTLPRENGSGMRQ